MKQDKWRNINVTAIWGSRQKAKLALKKNLLPSPKIDNNHMALSTVVQRDRGAADSKPLAVSGGISPNSKEKVSRPQNNFQLNISAIYSWQINGLLLVALIFFWKLYEEACIILYYTSLTSNLVLRLHNAVH